MKSCSVTYVGIESIAKALIASDHRVGCTLEFVSNAVGEILCVNICLPICCG